LFKLAWLYAALTHESSRVVVVGADLSVDLDKALSDNEGDLTASQSILELILKEDLWDTILSFIIAIASASA